KRSKNHPQYSRPAFQPQHRGDPHPARATRDTGQKSQYSRRCPCRQPQFEACEKGVSSERRPEQQWTLRRLRQIAWARQPERIQMRDLVSCELQRAQRLISRIGNNGVRLLRENQERKYYEPRAQVELFEAHWHDSSTVPDVILVTCPWLFQVFRRNIN